MKRLKPSEIVAYYRVSTDLQGSHGLGMAAQREAVRVYAEQAGLPIVASYEEVETGRKDDLKNRPALMSAVAHARRSGAILTIARIDRLARSVFVTAQLLASGVEFVACDNPHANRMTIQILAVMAEHEGRLISERTKAGLAAAKARGIQLGNPKALNAAARRKGQLAAGVAHRVRAREAYADLVPMFRAWCEEPLTMIEMARRLNASGHRTQVHGKWSVATVRRLLYRESLSASYSFPGRTFLPPKDVWQKGVEASAKIKRERTIQAYADITGSMIADYAMGKSVGIISEELNATGRRNQAGRPWKGASVSALLKRNGVAVRPSQADVRRYQHLGTVAAKRRRRAKHDEFRAKLLPLVSPMLERGATYKEAAKHLNRRGKRTSRGLKWTSCHVWCLVNR